MEETKQCTKCKRILPLSEFNWRDKTKGTRRADCKYCHNQYMKDAYKKKQQEIEQLKASNKCAKCGESRGYMLDFHHIDPSIKKEGIAQMIANNYNLNEVYNEIEKCICLCANCHREFHHFERYNNITLEDYLSS